jgi:sjoegren syndrome nuclear autoantigen 1
VVFSVSFLFEWIETLSLLFDGLGIEHLGAKRDELQSQIMIEEEEKHRLEEEIRIAGEKLSRVNESLSKKITARTEFDRTISETEAAYMKILESSQTLLNVRSSVSSSSSRAPSASFRS